MLRAILDTLASLDANLADYREALLEDVGQAKDPANRLAFDPVAYARRVASLPPDNTTRRAFDLCAALFNQIDQSGLTPTEAAFCKRKGVQPLTDDQTITADQLVAAIDAYIKLQGTVAANQ
jgi:hypothetical protein